MVKIAFWISQLDVRGTTVALYDYAHYNEELLGNESIVIVPRSSIRKSDPLGVVRIVSRFKLRTYKGQEDMDSILEEEKCDMMYSIKFGNKEGEIPKKIKNVIHCVFSMEQPHGDVYAGVSQAVARKYGKTLFVPHMIGLKPSETKENLREELGIPKDAIVFGRYGGADTFNIQFCINTVGQVVHHRPDIYFLFINTPQYVKHPHVKYLPKVISNEDKNKFINTCDAHLECGTLGHSFGLAMGEFSVNNKPIIAFKGPNMWNTAHLDILGKNALYFKNREEFLEIILQFNPEKYQGVDMNCYKDYMPDKVMAQFKKVFIDRCFQK